MIVSKKLLIAFAAIPIIMALLIAIPWISPSADQRSASVTSSASSQIRIQFIKEDMRRVSFGVTETIGAEKREVLNIDNDGRAFYNLDIEGEKGAQITFEVNSQELKRIKALVAETGFMQLPQDQFGIKEDVEEFTRYTLTINLDSQTKRVQWADEPASEDFVPPLVLTIKDLLLEAMKAGEEQI